MSINKRTIKKRIFENKFVVITVIFCLTVITIYFTHNTNQPTTFSKDIDPVHYKFDFGNRGTAKGYIGVKASDKYTKEKGYGFNTPKNMKNVNANGKKELRDAVLFKTFGTKSSNTFNVDLKKGMYEITIHTGITKNKSRILAEGYLQEFNIRSDGEKRTFRIPVIDGQLNLSVTSSFKESGEYTLSSLEVKKISDDPTMPQTIWLCGDSTVAEYDQREDNPVCGWGQVLHEFIDTSKFEIKNLSSGGQYAKSFLDTDEFKPVEHYGKKGDYFLMILGGNDTFYSNAKEFKECVSYMTDVARKNDIEVVYVKQPPKSTAVSQTPNLKTYWFNDELGELGEEKNVKIIDLFTPSFTFFKSIGQERTYTYFRIGDDEHTNEKGAKYIAEIVAKELDPKPLN